MRTVILRIDQANGDGFPLTLLEVSEGGGRLDPQVTAVLPADAPGLAAADHRALMLEELGASNRFAVAGDELFAVLAQGAVGEQLRALRGARIYFDIRPRHLRRVPWELMRRDELPLFAAEDAACARVGPQSDFAASADTERWPLRILVVDGSRPDDPIGADEELVELQVALRPIAGLVDLEILRRPTVAAVEQAYGQLRPHVFHFIGHGVATEDGAGALQLRDEDSEHDEDEDWPGDAIREQLRGWRPNVAIVNACRSANHDDHDGVWDVSDAFVDIGVPAVIGMQGDIPITAATTFTRALYGALASGQELDLAVRSARQRLRAGKGRMLRDFGLPVLHLSRPANAVLSLGHAVPEDERIVLERTRWNDLRAFVDRTAERRRVWRLAEPPCVASPDAATELDLLFVAGARGAGKSALVRSCLRTLELAGSNVGYVGLGGRTVTFLDVLRAFRDVLEASPVHGARNADAFRAFNHAVNHLLDGHAPPALPEGPIADRNVAFPDREPGPPDIIARLFAAFRGSLQATADKDEPLLLALDGLSHLEASDVPRLVTELLEQIALRHVPGVRMLLVDREPDVIPHTLNAHVSALRLTPFDRDEFCDLARLSLRQAGFRDYPQLGQAIDTWVQMSGQELNGDLLALFGTLGDRFGLERDRV